MAQSSFSTDEPRPSKEGWGLPDWHDADAYPDHKKVAALAWAWEFLRRNPEYRAFWDEKVVAAQKLLATKAPFDQPASETLDFPPKAGIWDGGTIIGMAEAKRRFGLWRPYDPRRSQGGAQFDAGSMAYWTGPYHSYVELAGTEVAIKFDFALPIAPQLERARTFLENKQGETTPGLRPHVRKFADYLRVLDAKEAGATDAEIAAVLYPRLDKDDGVQTVKNHARAACQIRDADYRIICCLTP